MTTTVYSNSEKIAKERCRTFLATLFDGVPGLIEARRITLGNGSVNRSFHRTFDSVLTSNRRGEPSLTETNVYVGVATRCDDTSGTKKNLCATRAVFVDIDFKDIPEGEARHNLKAFPLKPSMLVHSGGGLHVYWLLTQLVNLREVDQLQNFEAILRGITTDLHGDICAAEAARILRPPGTINFPNEAKQKLGRTPAPVELELLEPERRYDLAEFARFAALGRERPTHIELGSIPSALPVKIRQLIKSDELLRRRWEGNADGLGDQSRSGVDLSFASMLAHRGFTPEQVASALQHRPDGKALNAPLGYLERTLARAFHGVHREDSTDGGEPCTTPGEAEPDGAAGAGASVSSVSGPSLGSQNSWPERKPLPLLDPGAPPLELDMLPAGFRGAVGDPAERMQVPPEYIAVPMVVAAGSVIGRQLGIRPKKHDDWFEVPNLWGAVVARSGMLKSPAQRKGLGPISPLIEEARTKYQQAYSEWATENSIHEALRKGLLKRIESARQRDDQDKVEKAERELRDLDGDAPPRPVERRYKTNDPTVEKLAELMAENPRGLLLVRDELGGWLRSLDKPGREGDREFYLEAWNGRNDFTVDRIKRGTIHVPSLCISIVGGIQPGKLSEYVSDATSSGSRDDGLLQRFDLLVYPVIGKDYKRIDRAPDAEARELARTIFHRLDKLDLQALGCRVLSDGVPVLQFSDGAQEIADQSLDKLERRLRSGEIELPAMESHLAKHRGLMPTLALIFYLVEWARTQCSGPVPEWAVKMAIRWCGFLEPHLERVYVQVLNRNLHAAHLLAKRIEKGQIQDRNTVRSVYRKGWSGLATEQIVHAGLGVLSELGWIKILESGTGGRPRETIRLHPDFRAA